jgi:hypothetical protein
VQGLLDPLICKTKGLIRAAIKLMRGKKRCEVLVDSYCYSEKKMITDAFHKAKTMDSLEAI